MGGVVHRLQLEIGLKSRLAQMLVWKRWDGIDARTSLHRTRFVLIATLLGLVYLALNAALFLRRVLGVLLEFSR